jgi:hypothetical protein
MKWATFVLIMEGVRLRSAQYRQRLAWFLYCRHVTKEIHLLNSKKLVQCFYENGSRKREVLTNYIGEHYTGAIQSDRLFNYKILESDTYPTAIRLACFQHCKRGFLDIEEDVDAKGIVDIINSLYRKEHEIGKQWKPDEILDAYVYIIKVSNMNFSKSLKIIKV